MHDVETQAVLLGLVASHDEAQPVPCAEGLRDVPPETRALGAAGGLVHAEGLLMVCVVVLDGVRPEDAVDPVLRGVHELILLQGSRDRQNVRESPGAVADAAVHAQDLRRDETSEGQDIEGLVEEVEELGPELAQPRVTIIFKAVPLVHGPVFVVAAYEPNLLGEQHLVGEQQAENLELVGASVHEVAVEDEARGVALRGVSEGVEQQEDVAELTVNVAENPARGLGLHHRRLHAQDLARGVREERQRIHILRTEQVNEQALVVPIAIELVFSLFGDLHGQLSGPLHDHARTAANGLEDDAFLLVNRILVPQDVSRLLRDRGEIQDLGVHHLPNQHAPARKRLRVGQGSGAREAVAEEHRAPLPADPFRWFRPRGLRQCRIGGFPAEFTAAATAPAAAAAGGGAH
mmetsp:Transcript_113072/g.359272  ORF Transcript_113072/g.359272 Transcript_113072/m.359272 type:complete len:405 (-) Transcript_113072:738-1952(-)